MPCAGCRANRITATGSKALLPTANPSPIQQSAYSLEACAAAWIGMKLKRKLAWDAVTEMFVGDDAANALRGRKACKPEYDFELVLQRAGIV
jgi:hypothetical protein